MASELEPLGKTLDEIGGTLETNTDLSIRGFGILLLGRRFKRDSEEKITDPTDLILRGRGPDIPNL